MDALANQLDVLAIFNPVRLITSDKQIGAKGQSFVIGRFLLNDLGVLAIVADCALVCLSE